MLGLASHHPAMMQYLSSSFGVAYKWLRGSRFLTVSRGTGS